MDELSQTLFRSTPEQAADAAAAALAEGFDPDVIGEAVSLAANQLILRDAGQAPSSAPGARPAGSIHGASIGVHACDAANAWRNLAKSAGPRNTYACLILAAYQLALDRVDRGGDFLTWQPRPQTTDADRNCISNIRPEGIGYADAAFKLAHLLRAMRTRRLSGVQLKDDSDRLLLGRT